jgi:DegV family protein with EDD domain
LGIELIPFYIQFNGQSYLDGINLTPEDMYRLYEEHPDKYISSSQPSVGEFKSIYEKFSGEEIISIHLSSGLSGTFSSAQTAANLLPNESISVVDSRIVGPALGWIVEMSAFGARHGWPKARILDAINQLRQHTFTTASFSNIRYLIHSGRVSHIRGIIASMLKIKPIIAMNEVDGRFDSPGQDITVKRATQKMAEYTRERFGAQKLRLQLFHGNNFPGVDILRSAVQGALDCVEDEVVRVTTVLGAHAGPTVVGLAAAPLALFSSLTQ